MSRYSLRFGTTRIPMVEVTVPTVGTTYNDGSYSTRPNVVKRVYGFTTQHAYRRALRWVRQNGDPR